MTQQPQREYIIDFDTLNSMDDYFFAAIQHEENKTRLKELWKSNKSVILSRPHTSTPISDNTIEQQIAAWEKVLINYHPKEAAASHLKERIRGLKEALSLLSKHDTATAAKAREDMLKEPRDCATCNNNKNAPRVKK